MKIFSLETDEAALGYCSRLATLHGAPSLTSFARHLGTSVPKILAGSPDALNLFARAGGISLEMLVRRSVQRVERHRSINDQVMLYRNIWNSARYLSICPSCVCEGPKEGADVEKLHPVMKLSWLTRLLRICPEHGDLIVPLTTTVESIRSDLSSLATEESAQIASLFENRQSIAPTDFDKRFSERLLGGSSGVQFLDRLPFYIAVELVETVGIQMLYGHDQPVAKLTELQRARACQVGFEHFIKGEDGLNDYLKALCQRYLSTWNFKGPPSIAKTFGVFGEWLSKRPACDTELLRENTASVLSNHLPFSNADVLFGFRQKRNLHSVSSASAEHRLPVALVRNLFKQEYPSNDTSLDQLLVNAASIDPLLDILSNEIIPVTAQKRFHLSISQWNDLVDAGFITARKSVLKTNIGDIFDISELNDLKKKISEPKGTRPADFKLLANITHQHRHAVSHAILLILSGKLKYVEPLKMAKSGLLDVYISEKEYRELLKPEGRYLKTSAAVEKFLETNSLTLKLLSAEGYLTPRRHANSVTGINEDLFVVREVKQFKTNFVSAWELTRRWQSDVDSGDQRLRDIEIRPVIEFITPKATSFYSRDAFF